MTPGANQREVIVTAKILTGTKGEIAAAVAGMAGDVREAIVFIDEAPVTPAAPTGSDLFAEMEPYTVRAQDVDYSRESIYGERDPE